MSLPPEVGLCDWLELGWTMADLLHKGHRLNLLNLEALSTAKLLDGIVCVATLDEGPTLRQACAEEGVAFRTFPV